MIVAAQKIIENPLFENPTVIMLVDRNELESQLFGNLTAVGIGNVVAKSKEHLQELLSDDRRGLIVTMIHKFHGMPQQINLRKNIFVLVDEAHRTTGGELGNYLMGSHSQCHLSGFHRYADRQNAVWQRNFYHLRQRRSTTRIPGQIQHCRIY